MQSPLDQNYDDPSPTHPSQEPENSSALRVFQPYKPPLRQRKLTQTAIGMVLFLTMVIGCAAVTVWLFLPSMLPKLPITFL